MTDKPKPSTDRVAALRARNRAKGRVRREYSATPEEHESLAQRLRVLRSGKP